MQIGEAVYLRRELRGKRVSVRGVFRAESPYGLGCSFAGSKATYSVQRARQFLLELLLPPSHIILE